MRKNIIYNSLCILIILALSACDKLKDLINANFSFTNGETTFTLPATTPDTLLNTTMSFSLNLDSVIKANNAESGLKYLKNLKVNSIDLSLVSGSDSTIHNFSNIKTANVIFFSNLNPTGITIGNLPSQTDSTYKGTLSIPVNTTIDIKDYVQNAVSFSYQVSGTLKKPTTQALNCKIKVNYQVTCGL